MDQSFNLDDHGPSAVEGCRWGRRTRPPHSVLVSQRQFSATPVVATTDVLTCCGEPINGTRRAVRRVRLTAAFFLGTRRSPAITTLTMR
jgi:hypothetical protein